MSNSSLCRRLQLSRNETSSAALFKYCVHSDIIWNAWNVWLSVSIIKESMLISVCNISKWKHCQLWRKIKLTVNYCHFIAQYRNCIEFSIEVCVFRMSLCAYRISSIVSGSIGAQVSPVSRALQLYRNIWTAIIRTESQRTVVTF